MPSRLERKAAGGVRVFCTLLLPPAVCVEKAIARHRPQDEGRGCCHASACAWGCLMAPAAGRRTRLMPSGSRGERKQRGQSRVEGKASGAAETNETTMGDETTPRRMVYGSQRAVCGRLACP